MATDLFNKMTPPVPEALNELVGEGKKFQTVEDLAKGKKESDAFIEQLKTEQAALRAQLVELDAKAKEGATLKDLMAKLEATKPNSNGKDGTAGLSQDEISKLVLSTVEQRDKDLARTTNRTKANEEVLKKFQGDAAKASAYVEAKATELGLSKEALGNLSETSPAAFAQLLGLNVANTQSRATTDVKTVNTEALLNHSSGNKDATYYQALKRANSKEFWAPRTQQELFKYGQQHGMEALNSILYG